MGNQQKYPFTPEQWQHCIEVLKVLKDDPLNNPDNRLLGTLIKKIYKEAKKANRQQARDERKQDDLELIQSTTIVGNALNNTTIYASETYQTQQKYQTLQKPKPCYGCNHYYDQMHFHYHRLCPTCAEQSYNYRFTEVDLTGRNVILTGGRVKVGYATALRLLENGANLTVTTRFPALALAQFKKEKNYNQWKNRLFIYGLDLRNIKAVHAFIEFYKQKHGTLDILINNAAQTIKYTEQYYQPLIGKEQKLLELYQTSLQLTANETSVLDSTTTLLPKAIDSEALQLNRFGQPIDDRLKTSWNSRLEEVSVFELMEVNLINQIAPYILVKGLTPLLKASTHQFKFIINVTSTEGIFSHSNKTIYHPHTNMTKAALNMLTRTSAQEYEEDNIMITAVDVGWISTGAIEPLRERQFEAGYIPPLDPADGAARIFHPIIDTLQHQRMEFSGDLVKNFRKHNW